jgi:hypothetical protein
LDVVFDPWASEGSRVISCKLSDGSDIDTNATYTIAYFYGSLSVGGITPESSLGQTWLDSFLEWLDGQGGTIKVPTMTLKLAYGEGNK